MLILKNPLTLHSISAFGIFSDSLGEKIYGNYETFGAAVTGEDLIHMTVQEPDIYVGIQNNGPFLVDNQIHIDNQVRLELVNRLVNRLLLYSSPQFTYQDEVFIATILQKLGVTDINEFMQQIKLHMEENKLAVSLINRYFDEGREFAYVINQLLENSFSDSQELELIKKEYQSERCLHNDIFQRLMTAECSNTVYNYQNPIPVKERAAGSFQAIEWMQQADRILLSQLRENIYSQTNPVVFCSYSGYETKPLTVNELTRQKVIGRMSAAILENIVNVAGYALQYEYGSTNVWKNYSRIIYGSSENVLERFHSFQENGGVGKTQLKSYSVRMNELLQDELHLTELLEFADRSEYSFEENAMYEDMRQNIVLTMLENQNLQKQLVLELQAAQQAQMRPQSERYYIEERKQYFDEQNRFEAVYRILRQKKNENYFASVMRNQVLDKNSGGLRTERVLHFLTASNRDDVLQEYTDEKKSSAADNIQKPDEKKRDSISQYTNIQVLRSDPDLNTHPDGFDDGGVLEPAAVHHEEKAIQEERTDGIRREISKEIRNIIKKEEGTDKEPAHTQMPENGQAVYELIHRYAKTAPDSDVLLTENIELLSMLMQERALDENTDDLEDERMPAFLTEIGEENVLHKRTDGIKNEIGRELQKIADKERDAGYQQADSQTAESGQAVYELIHRYAETSVDSDVPLMENIELLEQINRHNLYMKQLLDSREKTAEPAKRVVVDRAQARDVALRAIDHPEQVLQEIYENAADKQNIPRELVNQIPHEIERILSVTDENTRSYYERLMGYRSEDMPKAELEHGEKEEDRQASPEQTGQEADAQNLFLETIASVLNITNKETQGLHHQRAGYPDVETMHPQENTETGEKILTESGQIRREEVQKKIYSFLQWIDRKERVYRTNNVIQALELEEQRQNIQLEKHRVDMEHRRELLNTEEIISLEHPDIVHRQIISSLQSMEKNVQMVHKTKEQTNQEVVDEVLETIENSSLLKQTVEKKNEETLLVEHQLEQIRNELIAQSREQLTYMVERNMKTHVHELSDMVYLELERRLKNEQRRRGY